MRSDVLIIGAGVIGLSTALRIKESNPSKRVIVIDKNRSAGQGNTRKSEGGYRNLFSSHINHILANQTVDYFTYTHQFGVDLGLQQIGYLWLLDNDKFQNIKQVISKFQKEGQDITIIDGENLRIPNLMKTHKGSEAERLNLRDIDKGIFAGKAGSIQPRKLAKHYEIQFLKLGGEIHYEVEAKKLVLDATIKLNIPSEPTVWQETIIVGAETTIGTIAAETTILAVSSWTNLLIHPIGMDALMNPKKRQVFALKDKSLLSLLNIEGFNAQGVLPLTILPTTGVYFKPIPRIKSFWVGCADDLGRPYMLEEPSLPEPDYFSHEIRPILSSYFTQFKGLEPSGMWAGHYSITSLDNTPVIEQSPGLIVVTGTSGSGIMKSDSLGRLVAAGYNGEEKGRLFGGSEVEVSRLSLSNRRVEPELFVI
jgi:glycine/D-amino acid oxidase-like deaminating enzyme